MGLGVALLVGVGLQFGSGVFTKDINVKHIISIGVLVYIYTIIYLINLQSLRYSSLLVLYMMIVNILSKFHH